MKRIFVALFMLMAPAFLRASTAPVILGLDYASPDVLLHIGSNMTVYMSAVIPTQTYNVSVTATTVNSITLGSTAFAGIFLPTDVFITDGTRTWKATAGGGFSTVTFGDSQLLMNAAPFNGADYTTMVNAPFRAYSGALITGFSAGSSMSVDIGSFDNVALLDAPGGIDPINNDGVWTGLYNVRDLGFYVGNGKLFGSVISNGQLASNGPYQSVQSFNLDGVRPAIDTLRISTGNTDYKGMLYLSSQSQLLNQFEPTNDAARFDVTVNKRGTIVDIYIATTPVKHLPSMVVPSAAATMNAFKIWNGDDGNGKYVADGIYPVTYYIQDLNGVSGITRTSQIRVVSLKMAIRNATLTPASLLVNKDRPPNTFDNVTLNYSIDLFNESGTDITPSMHALGWAGNTFGDPASITSTVVTDGTQNFLNADGSPFSVSGGNDDGNSLVDSDANMVLYFAKDPRLTVGQCYLNNGKVPPAVTHTSGAVVDVGDGDQSNDFDLLPGFQPPVLNPTLLTLTRGYVYAFSANTSQSLRMRITQTLAGWDVFGAGLVGATPDTPDFCSGVTDPYYRAQKVHFAPVLQMGSIQARDTTLIFNINQVPTSTLDTTPPLLLSNNPQNSTTFAPGSFGPSLPITFQIQDPESPIDPSNNTRIELRDPSGSIVGGISSTTGGGTNNTSTVTFTPFRNLTAGGTYKITLFACNTAALCLQKDVNFTIRDQTAPDVSSLVLISATQAGTIPLTLFQTSPDGPFDTITEVWATLSMPPTTSNTILWDLSTISLQQVSGTSTIAIPMVRVSPLIGASPSDSRLKYRLSSPITTAGLYEVVVQTYSQDGSLTQYTGPAAFINPRFTTLVNNNVLAIHYPDGTLAVTGTQPIFVSFTASSFTPSNANPAARMPDFNLFPPNVGYTPLSSLNSATSLQFVVGGVAQNQPATWVYPLTTPLRATLYYNNSDLPSGVLSSDLRIFGYNGTAWQAVSSTNYVHTFTNVTGNTFVIDLPNSSPALAAYSIYYPASANNNGNQAVATPVPFKSTRAFNPTHANSIYRKARFYYADTPAKSVEARVFDTSGQLLRVLTVGNPINLGDVQNDLLYNQKMYFFEWDGRNDSGTLARNGLYLVRWQVSKTDGSTETMTKPVALIK